MDPGRQERDRGRFQSALQLHRHHHVSKQTDCILAPPRVARRVLHWSAVTARSVGRAGRSWRAADRRGPERECVTAACLALPQPCPNKPCSMLYGKSGLCRAASALRDNLDSVFRPLSGWWQIRAGAHQLAFEGISALHYRARQQKSTHRL